MKIVYKHQNEYQVQISQRKLKTPVLIRNENLVGIKTNIYHCQMLVLTPTLLFQDQYLTEAFISDIYHVAHLVVLFSLYKMAFLTNFS